MDAASGRLLWKTKLETHPLARITGAPALYRDRLYVPMSSYEESQGARPDYGCCTFRGSLSALDARTGKVLWRTYMISERAARARQEFERSDAIRSSRSLDLVLAHH